MHTEPTPKRRRMALLAAAILILAGMGQLLTSGAASAFASTAQVFLNFSWGDSGHAKAGWTASAKDGKDHVLTISIGLGPVVKQETVTIHPADGTVTASYDANFGDLANISITENGQQLVSVDDYIADPSSFSCWLKVALPPPYAPPTIDITRKCSGGLVTFTFLATNVDGGEHHLHIDEELDYDPPGIGDDLDLAAGAKTAQFQFFAPPGFILRFTVREAGAKLEQTPWWLTTNAPPCVEEADPPPPSKVPTTTTTTTQPTTTTSTTQPGPPKYPTTTTTSTTMKPTSTTTTSTTQPTTTTSTTLKSTTTTSTTRPTTSTSTTRPTTSTTTELPTTTSTLPHDTVPPTVPDTVPHDTVPPGSIPKGTVPSSTVPDDSVPATIEVLDQPSTTAATEVDATVVTVAPDPGTTTAPGGLARTGVDAAGTALLGGLILLLGLVLALWSRVLADPVRPND